MAFLSVVGVLGCIAICVAFLYGAYMFACTWSEMKDQVEMLTRETEAQTDRIFALERSARSGGEVMTGDISKAIRIAARLEVDRILSSTEYVIKQGVELVKVRRELMDEVARLDGRIKALDDRLDALSASVEAIETLTTENKNHIYALSHRGAHLALRLEGLERGLKQADRALDEMSEKLDQDG